MVGFWGGDSQIFGGGGGKVRPSQTGTAYDTILVALFVSMLRLAMRGCLLLCVALKE